MKIALMGSSPSSMGLAPFGDPSWQIWGCSPGLYPNAARVDAWFELHRWEPPVIGKPGLQKPWFSPEYVLWMGQQTCPVWMFQPVPEIPTSQAYPVAKMIEKFGNYFMTSSLAWMAAMAIDQILLARQNNPDHDASQDAIGFWGVDMAATEEYGYQRAGCQYFFQVAANLGIGVVIPPESDLARPMPMYGISETSDFMVKTTARLRELEGRRNDHLTAARNHETQAHFLAGAIDDLKYMQSTWHPTEVGVGTHVGLWALSPYLAAKPAIQEPGESYKEFAEATAGPRVRPVP